jgi:hypothetical protein
MTEILTESFCERCGTRYTFEVARPQTSRIVRVRAFTKGVRNFVLSDDSSFSEAMAEARGEEERAATSLQLDEFHKTFNFCLSCRQYTCGNCWNDIEGRCLSCAPVPETEATVAPAAEAVAVAEAVIEPPAPIEASAWPTIDLPPAPAPVEAAIVEAVEPEAEAPVDATAAPVVETPAEVPLAAAAATPLLAGMEPGESLEDAIAAYEASQLAEAAAAVPEPVVAEAAVGEPVGVEPEPVGAVTAVDLAPDAQPEPVVAEAAVTKAAVTEAAVAEPPVVEAAAAQVGPEVVEAAAAQVEPELVEAAAEPELEPAAAVAAPSAVEPVAVEAEPVSIAPEPAIPAAAVAEPAPPPPATPQPTLESGWLTVAPDDGQAPSWPTTPAWPVPSPRRDVPSTLAGRPLVPQGDSALLWAASAREVMAGSLSGAQQAASSPVAVATPQPCVGCGLPLSASARFCRRCGTRQG